MLAFILSATILLTPQGAAATITQIPTMSDQERVEGFQSLVDATSTKFRAFRGTALPAKWKVVDGVLTLTKEKVRGGDIATPDEYKDFDFRWEWKVEEGGNSGVYYRSSEKFRPGYLTGPEYQLLDNPNHPDGKNPLTSAGSAYALYAPTEDVSKPAGEWNVSRILVIGNKVEHYLNGKLVVAYELNSPDWKERYAKSKFATFENYGQMPEGRIVLQDHGNEVSFRNVRVKRLN